MRVARVTVHAPVTSFRHPFFVTGKQPTFDFPPPSTIHGHCASALGTWPDPKTFFFGLHFKYRSRFVDLEHQHIVQRAGPRERVGETPANLSGTIQPVGREALFDATLTLYLAPEIGAAMRAPSFVVTLGRSQDLAEVSAVEEIDLERGPRARIEHTLLPMKLRPCVRFGSTVLLTRRISEPPVRDAEFAQYVALHEPVFYGGAPDHTRTLLSVEGVALDDLWIDPSIVDDDGFPRGVWLHRLMD